MIHTTAPPLFPRLTGSSAGLLPGVPPAPKPGTPEAAALLRLEIRRLPPAEQSEMQRLRMTALEMALPEDVLWMFLLTTSEPALPVRREAFRFRRCTAARLRIRSRGERRSARRARVRMLRRRCQVPEDRAKPSCHFLAPARAPR